MVVSVTPRNKQQGISLIEVLVAAVIIAIGLLGLAGLQTRSLQMNQSSHYRSQASYYAYEIVDAMRMNEGAAEAGDFAIDMGDGAPSGSSVPEKALSRWIQGINASLPTDETDNVTGGSVDTSNFPEVEIRVAWVDERWSDDANDQVREVTVETELQ